MDELSVKLISSTLILAFLIFTLSAIFPRAFKPLEMLGEFVTRCLQPEPLNLQVRAFLEPISTATNIHFTGKHPITEVQGVFHQPTAKSNSPSSSEAVRGRAGGAAVGGLVTGRQSVPTGA